MKRLNGCNVQLSKAVLMKLAFKKMIMDKIMTIRSYRLDPTDTIPFCPGCTKTKTCTCWVFFTRCLNVTYALSSWDHISCYTRTQRISKTLHEVFTLLTWKHLRSFTSEISHDLAISVQCIFFLNYLKK